MRSSKSCQSVPEPWRVATSREKATSSKNLAVFIDQDHIMLFFGKHSSDITSNIAGPDDDDIHHNIRTV